MMKMVGRPHITTAQQHQGINEEGLEGHMRDQEMTGRPVRLAVIGAGYWALANHVSYLTEHDDAELVAVSRLGKDDLATIKGRYGFRVASEDYREALDAGVDAAIIATPNHLHHEHAVAALERGLHILVEKPLAITAKQAWDIALRAERAELHAVVPYGWHYKPFVQRARRHLAEGRIGVIRYVACHMASPTPAVFEGRGGYGAMHIGDTTFEASPSTWAEPERGGGYAFGQLSHSLGLLAWLTGLRATAATAQTRLGPTGVDVADAAIVEYDHDVLATVSGWALAPTQSSYQLDIRVFGSEGMLLLDVERERCDLRRYDGVDDLSPVPAGEGDYECFGPPAQFLDLIQGRTTDNPSPAGAAARAVEVIEMMLRSADDYGRRTTSPVPGADRP